MDAFVARCHETASSSKREYGSPCGCRRVLAACRRCLAGPRPYIRIRAEIAKGGGKLGVGTNRWQQAQNQVAEVRPRRQAANTRLHAPPGTRVAGSTAAGRWYRNERSSSQIAVVRAHSIQPRDRKAQLENPTRLSVVCSQLASGPLCQLTDAELLVLADNLRAMVTGLEETVRCRLCGSSAGSWSNGWPQAPVM